MQWLNKVADDITAAHPKGEILIESGSSPSGTYHLGHLRELIICDAILTELRRRGRDAKHVSYIDDLDGLRKIPVNVPADFEQYLGRPLCDIPAPDGAGKSYAEYFLKGLREAAKALAMDVEFIRSHKKYRAGFFVPAIEVALQHTDKARQALEKISGRQLDENWSPIQIMESGYLKKRRFMEIDINSKTLVYEDSNGARQTTSYAHGEVKLDWRLDWPGRWWLLDIGIEPFGRDHATKGGSYDTGVQIMTDVYKAPPPLAVPYDFVNLAGDTKKMSASKGTGLDALGVIRVLPPEIVRFFMLRYPPAKRLYFDPESGVAQLIDEFAELLAKDDKTADDEQLLYICRAGLSDTTVSRISFSHLVNSYQAALKNPDKTLEILSRTESKPYLEQNSRMLTDELKYIDNWLKNWAPEDTKFDLLPKPPADITETEAAFLLALAKQIEAAPDDADGEWFHKAVYDLQASSGLSPKKMFGVLYTALIGKQSGPRAGWFLSILPRGWLIKRLRLEA